MPFCPKCGYEYLPTVTVCPDCGEPLVAQPPPEQEPIEEPLVSVYEAPSEVMQVMVRTVLEEAGIPSVLHSGLVPWYDGIRFTADGFHSRLLVFESQAPEAQRLVREYLAEIEAGQAEREALKEEAGSEPAQGNADENR